MSALSQTRTILRSCKVDLHFEKNGRDPGIKSPVKQVWSGTTESLSSEYQDQLLSALQILSYVCNENGVLKVTYMSF